MITARVLVALALGSTLAVAAPRSADGPTTPAERALSWKQHVEMAEASPFKDLEWRAVGPRHQGGRVECFARPPGTTSVLYVGVGAGNLWKSVNHGTTWKPIFEHQSTFTIGDVAVASSNPEIVWVGTGEVLMARSSFAGDGVFKSEDGGQTWLNLGLRDSHHIGRVLIDPEDADVVYVAAIGHNFSSGGDCGLFKTSDGGKSWRPSLILGDGVGVVEVVMDPLDSRTLYAVAWQRSRRAWGHQAHGAANGIYKSTDAGNSWERLGGGLPAGERVGRIAIAVAPTRPEVLYALVCIEGQGGELYRSDDRGKKWRKTNQEQLKAGYDFCLVNVSPDDEDEVYLPGQSLLHSTDGGRTFDKLDGTVVHLLDHDARCLHLDSHAMWIDPFNTDRLIIGNDGGLYVSHDRGATWLHLNNLPIGEFYAVSVDLAEPYNIYGGTQDNAALLGPSTAEPKDGEPDPWRSVYLDPWGGGDSFHTPVDPTDPNTVYYEHQFGDLRRKNLESGEVTWIQPRASMEHPPDRTNWMTPFFISSYDSSTLYYGANVVLKSTDRGDSWEVISPDLTSQPGPEKQGNVPFGTLTSLSESKLRRGLIYAGADDGFIHLTRDDGASWERIDEGLPEKWVSRVVASLHREGTVYATFSGYVEDDFSAHVYRSDDFGASWTELSAGLPSESVNVVREDPTNENLLYLGTDLGVYVSLNRGDSWLSLCANLPTTPVRDLVVHPRESELVIGTHGRSVYVLDVASIRDRPELPVEPGQ